MEFSIRLIVLTVVLLIVALFAIMFITNAGQSSGSLIDSIIKWITGSAKF